tara:strand:- start:11410 stop:11976 length:567 start_codon:yes stop_codon:yes gene_type:complete
MKGIILSGMPAVGKTTAANSLCKEFNIQYYSGGDLLKEIAKEKGFAISGLDWWDNKEGMNFLSNRMDDSSFDKLVDKRLIDLLDKGDVVITSYTLPWLTSNGISIWLDANKESRTARLCSRDGISVPEGRKIVDERDNKNQQIYKKLYNIELGRDLSVFDKIIDTNDMDINQVCRTVINLINETLGIK